MSERTRRNGNLANKLYRLAAKYPEEEETLTEAANTITRMCGEWSAMQRVFQQAER